MVARTHLLLIIVIIRVCVCNPELLLLLDTIQMLDSQHQPPRVWSDLSVTMLMYTAMAKFYDERVSSCSLVVPGVGADDDEVFGGVYPEGVKLQVKDLPTDKQLVLVPQFEPEDCAELDAADLTDTEAAANGTQQQQEEDEEDSSDSD